MRMGAACLVEQPVSFRKLLVHCIPEALRRTVPVLPRSFDPRKRGRVEILTSSTGTGPFGGFVVLGRAKSELCFPSGTVKSIAP